MDAYEQVRVIGKGSFGVVTEIIRKSDGKVLVWKEVNYGAMSEKEKQLIVSEVNILRELRHPHIVRYLDRVIDKQATKIYIVMEYCEGGDLSQFIKRKKREGSYIEEDFIWHVFTHVYLALRECHRHREGNVVRPILHRDIKPGNIFLDSNGNAKLGDFGLAKELKSESRFAQTNVGTPYYMSPEMVNEMTYDERSDIWALGCLLYEMATLAPPFDATNQLALAKKINAGRFARIPSQYSEGLFQAIRWQLHRQRSRRPRVEDLERIPELQQRLRAYAAANPALFHSFSSSSTSTATSSTGSSSDIKQLQATYNQKMKELLTVEEDLRHQEAALNAREKKLKELEADLVRREAALRKREQFVKGSKSSIETLTNADQDSVYDQMTDDAGPANLSPFSQPKQSLYQHSNSPDQQPAIDSPDPSGQNPAVQSSSVPTTGSSNMPTSKSVLEIPSSEVSTNISNVKQRLYTGTSKSCTGANPTSGSSRSHASESARKPSKGHFSDRGLDSAKFIGDSGHVSSKGDNLSSTGSKSRGGNVVSLMKGLWKKNH